MQRPKRIPNHTRYADSIAIRTTAVHTLLTMASPGGWTTRDLRMAAHSLRKSGYLHTASVYKQAARALEATNA